QQRKGDPRGKFPAEKRGRAAQGGGKSQGQKRKASQHGQQFFPPGLRVIAGILGAAELPDQEHHEEDQKGDGFKMEIRERVRAHEGGKSRGSGGSSPKTGTPRCCARATVWRALRSKYSQRATMKRDPKNPDPRPQSRKRLFLGQSGAGGY